MFIMVVVIIMRMIVKLMRRKMIRGMMR